MEDGKLVTEQLILVASKESYMLIETEISLSSDDIIVSLFLVDHCETQLCIISLKAYA